MSMFEHAEKDMRCMVFHHGVENENLKVDMAKYELCRNRGNPQFLPYQTKDYRTTAKAGTTQLKYIEYPDSSAFINKTNNIDGVMV